MKKTTANSRFAIGGVSSPLDTFVVIESSFLRINICGKKPAHRKSGKPLKIKKEQLTLLCGFLCF